jgi:MoaA/NifB/PqqE/SkfB family radical SAM enzyme
VSLHVSFVVCDANQHEAEDFVEQWRQYQGVQIWLHPLNNRNTLLSPDMKPVDVGHLVDAYRDDPRVIVDVFGHINEDPRMCKVAKSMIFISADGVARLCAMDYRRVTSYGSLLQRSLVVTQRIKLAMYRRGDMNEFCGSCDFCPSAIRSERNPLHVLRVI